MTIHSRMRVFVFPLLVALVGCGGTDPTNNTTGAGNSGGQGGGGNSGGQGGEGNAGGQGGSGNTGGQGGGYVASNIVLDTTFGENGIARASRPYSTDNIYAADWMPDGSILYGGSTGGHYDFQSDALLARFTSAGEPDTTFGNGGFILLPLGNRAKITDIESFPDGSAIVGGIIFHDTAMVIDAFLARIDANGALVPTFGTNGLIRVPSNLEYYARVARSDAGQILFFIGEGSDASILRYDANGNLDTTFGNGGRVTFAKSGPRDLLVEPDGSYLVLSIGYTFADNWLYHLDQNGAFDASFGVSGRIAVPENPLDIERHDSGKILVAGGDAVSGWIVQFDSNGQPDIAFGANGAVSVPFNRGISALEWLSNGDFLAVEASVGVPPGGTYANVHRFAPDGTPVIWNSDAQSPLGLALAGSVVTEVLQRNGDVYFVGSQRGTVAKSDREIMTMSVHDDAGVNAAFGTDGLVMVGSKAPPEQLFDMARASDGSIIAKGVDAMFARFVNGKHDTTWSTNGFMEVSPKPIAFYSFNLDEKDRLVIGGFKQPGPAVGRFLQTGDLDTSFGTMGVSMVLFNGGGAYDIVVDNKQRIIGCGGVFNLGPIVMRFLDDGTLDPVFGPGATVGVADPAAGIGEGNANKCLVDANDKITLIASSVDKTYFARLNEDGTRDTSFGTAGGPTVVMKGITASDMIPRKSGGFLVVGGTNTCSTGGACDTFVMAFRGDGTFDEGFGTGGFTQITEATNNAPNGLAELPNGEIVVAGSILDDITSKLVLWVLRPDGTMDANAKRFVLPFKSGATSALLDNNGLLIGGWADSPITGADMVLLRFTF